MPGPVPREASGRRRCAGRRQRATINAIAQGETRFGTTQGGTPTSLTFSRISQFQGSIKRAGSPVGNLTGGSVTYSNNLEKIETIRDDGLSHCAVGTCLQMLAECLQGVRADHRRPH
jgi:hypothetical protein